MLVNEAQSPLTNLKVAVNENSAEESKIKKEEDGMLSEGKNIEAESLWAGVQDENANVAQISWLEE